MLSYPAALPAFTHTEWLNILPYERDKTGLLPAPPLYSCPKTTIACVSSGPLPESLGFSPTDSSEPYSRYDMVDGKSGVIKPVYYMNNTSYQNSLDTEVSKLFNTYFPLLFNSKSVLANAGQLMVKPDLLVTTEKKAETILVIRDAVLGWQVLRIPGITNRDDVPSLFELKDGLALSINIRQDQIVTTFNSGEEIMNGVIFTSEGLFHGAKKSSKDQEPVDSGTGSNPDTTGNPSSLSYAGSSKRKPATVRGGNNAGASGGASGGGGGKEPHRPEKFKDTTIDELSSLNINELINLISATHSKHELEKIVRAIIQKQNSAPKYQKLGRNTRSKIFAVLNRTPIKISGDIRADLNRIFEYKP